MPTWSNTRPRLPAPAVGARLHQTRICIPGIARMGVERRQPKVGTDSKEANMFGDIVVGVDESPGGRDALALAKRLVAPDAKLTLAHVIVIHAWQPWASGAARAAGEREDDLERERADELLRTARDQSCIAIRCGEISLKSVWSSSVGRGLHELAEGQRADLLVLGSSRRGLLGRVAVGDDTRAALNGAPCAVAVAPAGYAGSLESEAALEIARRLSLANDAELSACTAVTVPLPAIGPGPMPLTDV